MNKLPTDYCRCFDEGCSQRLQCLRWLDRMTGYEHTPRAQSCFPYDVPIGGKCTSQIKPTKKKGK